MKASRVEDSRARGGAQGLGPSKVIRDCFRPFVTATSAGCGLTFGRCEVGCVRCPSFLHHRIFIYYLILIGIVLVSS